jgi:hypothetical protein
MMLVSASSTLSMTAPVAASSNPNSPQMRSVSFRTPGKFPVRERIVILNGRDTAVMAHSLAPSQE